MPSLMSIAALGLSILAGQSVAKPVAIDPVSAAPIRVNLIGGSIVGDPGCWRGNLWNMLQDANIKNVDFVGTRKEFKRCGKKELVGFDAEHDGASGLQAWVMVKKDLLRPILEYTHPDIIVVHLGSNDAIQQKPAEETIGNFTILLEQMRQKNPDVIVLWSLLIPLRPGKFGKAPERVERLNEFTIPWIEKMNTERSPVILVDNFHGFDPMKDTDDGEHTNLEGDVKVAKVFFQPLADAIRKKTASQQKALTANKEEVENEYGREQQKKNEEQMDNTDEPQTQEENPNVGAPGNKEKPLDTNPNGSKIPEPQNDQQPVDSSSSSSSPSPALFFWACVPVIAVLVIAFRWHRTVARHSYQLLSNGFRENQ
ncbi:carbohydrate esterase family 3 protein [Aaosphaeria arxii CBS 175.79]|uniref:Carbohydrate esterase family 3 protein n=1 Tax=Aaosphaeria arxii CBS 175.79 TaxID=1450172 RepID=A0A6A5Y7J8_9PLEO|nr:carbohydrate esterase family 3 protein [Aaosphaeria arxii CBS 175.79]KAF2021545.1 carbohydrate esterase family 3 protein [Aaosphaeria arxii CBS 175.79]